MKKLLDDPENSGIDTKSNLVFFVQKTPGNNYNIVLEGNLKDEKVFEQFNKNLDPASDLKKDGDINLLTLRQQGVVGWDDTHFAYVTNSGSFRSKYAAPWDTPYDQSNMAPAVENSVAISSYCKNLFSLKTDSSLAKNERFANPSVPQRGCRGRSSPPIRAASAPPTRT
jgi:hypothetical protein